MSDRWDWVEILEPRTKECIYANLTTGECVWEPPPGVRIKRTDRSHWWELFDEKTSRFYYYNAVTQETAWHRPTNCDIIPLAKLQSLKQNTKVPDRSAGSRRTRRAEKREISTQTPATVSSVSQLRPRSRKAPGSRSMRSQSSSDDQGSRGHASLHMAQEAASRCQGYEGSRSPNSIQPFSDGGGFPLLSSRTGCTTGQFSPQPLSRRSQNHEVGSNGESSTVPGENLADDSPLEPPPDPWHQRLNSLHGKDVGACVTYDNPADFFGDLSGSLYEDLLQMSSFHPPPQQQSKIPAFPRTNPSYVAQNCRSTSSNGGTVSPERHQVPNGSATAAVNICLSQLSHSYLGDVFDERRGASQRNRVNSDASQSSFGVGSLPGDVKNSAVSPSSSRVRHQTDSLSSQGSVSGKSDAAFSTLVSKSSVKYGNERCGGGARVSAQTSLPLPHHTSNIDSNCHRQARLAADRSHSTPTYTRRNSEPDYANLPLTSRLAIETTAEQQQTCHSLSLSNRLRAATAADEVNGTSSFSSPSSSSPAEFSRKEYGHRFGRSVRMLNSEGSVDQDSETGSVFSSPLFEPWQPAESGFGVRQLMCGFEAGSRVIGKSKSLDVDDGLVPQLSLLSFTHLDEDWNVGDPTKSSGSSQTGIEQFALENFNEHRHGILGKAVSIGNMLTWTKDIISKPMIRTQDKVVKKEAPEVFRLIQMYMTDRKAKSSPQMQIALEVVQKGWNIVELRDEIYMQLCRQTTENPKEESLIRGWELMGVCLSVFPPSFRFHSYMEKFFGHLLNLDESKTLIVHFAGHCQRQLERTSRRGAKGSTFKLTIDYVEQTLKSIFHPSNFGGTLEDIMQIQRERFPDRQLPWIQTTLSEEVLRLNGAQTEGIFRVSGDSDEVNTLRTSSDQWNVPNNCTDLHVLASLLKQWYRELYEPLIPTEFYNDCVESCSDPDAAVAVVERLPHINRLVFSYLIRFLQVFAAFENASVSKMDANNLATVMAPNCLRCVSEDPNVMLKNTHKEASFIKTLILNLDTSFMDGIW